MKNKAQKTLNGIMIIVVMVIVASYIALNIGSIEGNKVTGAASNQITGMVTEEEVEANSNTVNNPQPTQSVNQNLVATTLKEGNLAYKDNKDTYYKDAQGTQKLEKTTASGYDWFFYTENGKKTYYDYQVSSTPTSSTTPTPVLSTTTSTTVKIIDNKLYSISYGNVKEYTPIPGTSYYYGDGKVIQKGTTENTITEVKDISVTKDLGNGNYIYKQGDTYYYAGGEKPTQIKDKETISATINGKSVKISLENGEIATYTSIDSKNTLYADEKGIVYQFDKDNNKIEVGYNYKEVSSKDNTKSSWYTDKGDKNTLHYSEDNGVTYTSYDYTQDYLGNIYLKDEEGNYYIVERTSEKDANGNYKYTLKGEKDKEGNTIDALDYTFTSWGTTIDKWVYYTSGFSGFSMFYNKDDSWIYGNLDETMQNILGGIDGWSSFVCSGEVSSTDGSVAGAYSSNPGGGYAYIKGERITYINYTESSTNEYYVYKVSGYVDPESCGMEVKFVRKCDDGTSSLFVDSETDSDYVFTLEQGDDPIAYSGSNMIVAQTTHLCSQVCIQFNQIATGCLNGVSEGDELCSTIVEGGEQSFDLDCGDFYCGFFGILGGASTGASGFIGDGEYSSGEGSGTGDGEATLASW